METTFKDTTLGQIPEEWEVTTVDKILVNQRNAIVDGPFGSNMKNSDYVDSGVPVLQGKNITGNRFVWSDIRYISYEKAQELIRSKVVVGDVLLVKIGSIGYSALIDTLYGFNYAIIPANLLKMSINEVVYSKAFLLQYLQDMKTVKRLQNSASQTAQPALSLKTVRKFVIMKPPLPEQRKIAEVLSTVDEAIEKADAIIQETQQLKKGLMQKLFTEGIGHTKFKETKIGRIPDEWDVAHLGDFCERITKGTTPTSVGFGYQATGINFIKVESIDSNGNFLPYLFAHINNETHNALERSIIKENDLLFSIAGALGRVALANKDILPANTNQALGIIRLKQSSAIDVKYIYFYLKGPQIQKHIQQINVQSAQANLTLAHLNKFQILLPPLDEQCKITGILSEVDTKIKTEQAFKSELELLKKGLMQVLLTGQVRVKV